MKPTREPDATLSVATAQGTRDHQEDRVIKGWIDLPSSAGWLLAVFDGHGGSTTAEKASAAFPALFRSRLEENQGNPAKAFYDSFQTLNEQTCREVSGSTATAVFIPADGAPLTYAILGDSPLAVRGDSGILQIGPTHNVRINLEERMEAQRRGGIFRKGYLEDRQWPDVGIQMTRALGDVALARVLNRQPEIGTYVLGRRGTVLIGSDGLFESADQAEGQLSRLMTLIEGGADAQALVDDALARQTGDNVSAIVWRKD